MKTILLCLFIGLTNFFMVQGQITFEVRDAYTFESVNGLSFKTKGKLSEQTNAVYQIESAQFPLVIEIIHPDYEPYQLNIPNSGSAVAITVYMTPNTQTENETVVSANKSLEKRKMWRKRSKSFVRRKYNFNNRPQWPMSWPILETYSYRKANLVAGVRSLGALKPIRYY